MYNIVFIDIFNSNQSLAKIYYAVIWTINNFFSDACLFFHPDLLNGVTKVCCIVVLCSPCMIKFILIKLTGSYGNHDLKI